MSTLLSYLINQTIAIEPFYTHQDGRLQLHLRISSAICLWGIFTFAVFKLSCTCTGGTNYLMSRSAAEQALHDLRPYHKEDKESGLVLW